MASGMVGCLWPGHASQGPDPAGLVVRNHLVAGPDGGGPGVPSVIGLDEVPGLDAGGGWPAGMPVRAGFQPVPATKGQLLFI